MALTVLGVAVRERVQLGGGAARVMLADGRTVLVNLSGRGDKDVQEVSDLRGGEVG